MKLNPSLSTLIFIDLQSRLMPSINDGNEVLKKCIRIAKIAMLLKVPIIGTEQSPHSLGHNVDEITQFCQNIVSKDHFDACQDDLIKALPRDRKHLVLAGCEAHVCVMQTALELLRQKYQVFFLVDAIVSRRSLDKDIALQRLYSAGAIPLTVEMLAFEWLGSATNPSFKEVLNLLKEQ